MMEAIGTSLFVLITWSPVIIGIALIRSMN